MIVRPIHWEVDCMRAQECKEAAVHAANPPPSVRDGPPPVQSADILEEGEAMDEAELQALMAELEQEAGTMSQEDEEALRLECYKDTLAGVLEGQSLSEKLQTIEHFRSTAALELPLPDRYLEHLEAVHLEQVRIAEEEGLRGGDILISTGPGSSGPEGDQSDLTVKQLKMMIEERRNIPIAHQRLVFAGTELENSRTIRAYSIPKSAVVFLVLRRPANALVNISVLMTQTGESFVLDKVPVDDTLADLKEKIQAQAGVLSSNQVLVFAGNMLADDEGFLVDFGMGGTRGEDAVKLHLVLRRPYTQKISVTTLFGRTMELAVNGQDKVEEIKQRLQWLTRIHVADQNLIYTGKELSNRCALSDYAIPDGASLDLILEKHAAH